MAKGELLGKPFRGLRSFGGGTERLLQRRGRDDRMSRRRTALLAAGGLVTTAALWWRSHPSACPYGQRWMLDIPHPFITRARLLTVLAPRPGERILEVGPGSGYYTLAVAERLGPDGRLGLLDVQQEMLDHTIARARSAGLANVNATCGDAQALPYEDATFDAAYLVTVLGEVPDQVTALHELARVLKPTGRLIVGELFGDPHWVSPRSLSRGADAAGLETARRIGTPLAYFAEFRARSS